MSLVRELAKLGAVKLAQVAPDPRRKLRKAMGLSARGFKRALRRDEDLRALLKARQKAERLVETVQHADGLIRVKRKRR